MQSNMYRSWNLRLQQTLPAMVPPFARKPLAKARSFPKKKRKPTSSDNAAFGRIIAMPPGEFVALLKKKKLLDD